MSIASRITEMETHINNAYTSIDNLGIDISNTNKNIYNISTLLDTFYEKLPKVSGIGASLSLSPSMVGKIKLNEIQGNTLQDSQPTPDTPVPIQSVTGLQNVEACGKNLTDLSTYQEGYVNTMGTISPITSNEEKYSVFIKIQPSTTYTFKIVETSSTKENWIGIGEYTEINFDSFIKRNTMATPTQNYLTFTTSATAQYIVVSARNLIQATKIQLEESPTATTYEPYKGNTYEVNLGKNLFDKTKNIVDGKAFGPSGELLNNSNFFYQNFYIPVIPNTTYTVSKTTGSNSLRICEYDSSKTFIKRNYEQQTITTGSTTYFIRLSNYKTQIDAMQLEKGSSSTSYSQYFTPIELNKIGTYKDSIKKSTGKNLFDGIVEQGEFQVNGNINTSTTTRKYSVDYIPVVPSENYVSNYNINRMCFYDSNKTFISRSTNYNFNTFTIPNNAYYIRFDISTNYNTNTLQIEQGSSSSPYEPYGKVWYTTKNAIKYNVDTTQLTLKSNYTNIEYAEIPKPSNYAGYNSYDHTEIKYTNANWIEMSAGGWDLSNNIGKISGNADKLKWWVGFAKGTGLDVIKTALTGSYIVYPLSTPTYEVITNTELIEQLESLNNAKSEDGTTNINVTSEDLSMILNVGVLKGDA